ncbi:MAG: hypothetical protein JWM91_816 [Rhodospirillales bacterium]|nr:hypothetical protein [Rhodospirillales bacterium]
MEKLVYALWKGPEDYAEFNKRLLGPLRKKLSKLGADRLQINVVDDTVAPGAALCQEKLRPGPAALVSFWLNSSHIRKPFEKLLEAEAPRIAGYAVTESTVLPITKVHKDGTRTQGFSQIALIQRPPRVTYEEYLDTWLGSHTQVGVETQSNFYYCQNIVNRVLTAGSPLWASIVEECFPLEAMTDPQAFYDAAGNEEKYQERFARMMNSCGRFIDVDKIDVLITSEFRFGGWADDYKQPAYESARGAIII